ncbi:MAG: immunity 8 family protein [Candidatus Sedimenticola sp. (ex Thyasira tokunagai)]
MNPELKRLHSPDVDDLESYRPEVADKFGFLLQAMIGPEGKEGEESFDIEVCTPRWLEETYDVDEIVMGRHHLIVREYNYQRLVKSIQEFLKGCVGEDWGEVAGKVSRLGMWEFEDYVE